jgi:putative endonuclease
MNHGGFTARAKDWQIVFSQQFETKAQAQDRERKIKKWKSRRMIERLLSSGH